MDWLVLALALVVLPIASFAVWQRPVWALYAFVVGLAFHNAIFVLLFEAGAGGWQLNLAQAWKEVLLAVALARVGRDAVRARALPFTPGAADVLAVAFAAVVIVYALLPQGVLDGQAGAKAHLLAVRHDLVPVGAFLVGRAVVPGREELRRLAYVVLGVAAAVAAIGIVEEYAVPLSAWRTLGAADYFRSQLDLGAATGPAGLPENWVLNSSDGVFRRLVSTFLSPLGAAYLFVVALFLAAAFPPRRRRGLYWAACLLVFAGLLFSFTRSGVLALVGGLLVLALARRRLEPVVAAVAVAAIGVAFAAAFPKFAPETAFFPEDLPTQAAIAREKGDLTPGNPLQVGLRDPSSESHLGELRRGASSLVHHPQGYGLGNSGQAAQREGIESRAGESVYLEIGADTGVLGLALWLGFSGLVVAGLLARAWQLEDADDRRVAASICAAASAMFAIAVISDVWGDPWNTYVLWWLAGSGLSLASAGAVPRVQSARRRARPLVPA